MEGLDDFLKPVKKQSNELLLLTDKYKDSNLIVFCLQEMEKEKKQGEPLQDMAAEQLNYIMWLDDPNQDKEQYYINKSTVVIWTRTNKLFAKCLEIIKEAQAEQAESVLWTGATDTNNKDSISRMFALKARKPEYRDNAVAPGASVISVRVSIDGNPYSVQAKDVTPENGE
jgi:hypothetical protein